MTTRLSNKDEVELVQNGKDITLKYKNIDEFIRITLDTRFKEDEKQMQAIRKGFEIIFPITVTGILAWKEAEYRIIGPTKIYIEQLKKITCYSSCSENYEYIQRFWRTLEGFTQEERSMYLKLVWVDQDYLNQILMVFKIMKFIYSIKANILIIIKCCLNLINASLSLISQDILQMQHLEKRFFTLFMYAEKSILEKIKKA